MSRRTGAVSAPTRRAAARPAWPLFLTLLILLFGAFIRLTSIRPPNQTPDETVYTDCGAGFYAYGTGFMRMHIEDCWERRNEAEYPWPTRSGYFALVALAMTLRGDTTVNSGAALSTGASLVVLALVAWLAWRWFGVWTAAMALLFLATSPLDLAIAGRAWQDEVVAMFVLVLIHAYVRSVARPERPHWLIGFFLVGACAMTVKETAALVVGAGTIGLLVAAWKSEQRARSIAWVLGGGVVAACAAGAWVFVIAGGAEPMRKSFELWTLASVPNEYMRRYQMGGPGYYAVGLYILNAVPFALGLVAAVALAARARFMRSCWANPQAVTLLTSLAWLVLAFGAVACIHSQKNMRFLSVIFVPVFILAAALVCASLAALKERIPRGAHRAVVLAVALALAVSAAADLVRFHQWFIIRGVPDLATPWFTGGGG